MLCRKPPNASVEPICSKIKCQLRLALTNAGLLATFHEYWESYCLQKQSWILKVYLGSVIFVDYMLWMFSVIRLRKENTVWELSPAKQQAANTSTHIAGLIPLLKFSGKKFSTDSSERKLLQKEESIKFRNNLSPRKQLLDQQCDIIIII